MRHKIKNRGAFVVILLIFLLLCIHESAWADSSPPQSIQKLYKQTIPETGTEVSILYSLLLPDNMQRDRKYPLILILHGRGGTSPAAALLATPWMRKEFPAIVLMPQIIGSEIWAMPGHTDPSYVVHTHVMKILQTIIDTYPVDKSRIYLTGHSMGGVGAYGLLTYYPDTFAAAAILSGIWVTSDADKIARTPLWIFQGDSDTYYPVKDVRKLVEKLKQKNPAVQYTEYPNTGHNLKQAYYKKDVWAWMFAQKKVSH